MLTDEDKLFIFVLIFISIWSAVVLLIDVWMKPIDDYVNLNYLYLYEDYYGRELDGKY